MITTFEHLMRLPVVTESGHKLGHMYDVELDGETHAVRKYLVKQGVINKEEYLVAPLQIKSITAEQITVEDSVYTTQSVAPNNGLAPGGMPDVANIDLN